MKLTKPIVAASSHVLGDKDVDEGECVFGRGQLLVNFRFYPPCLISFFCPPSTGDQKTLALLLKDLAQHHLADFQAAVSSLPAEQQAKLSAAVSAV